MRQQNISILESDLDYLISKHSELIKKNDFSTALNVIKNIDHVNHQLKSLGYQELVSKYTLVKDGGVEIEPQKLISIWKQDAFGNIKDLETYKLGEKYVSKDVNKEENLNISDTKEYKNPWYDILKYFIETKQSQIIQLKYGIVDEENKHRGTGKSTALLRLSNDYNVPILCFSSVGKKLLKEKAQFLNLSNVKIFSCNESYNVFTEEIILVDDYKNFEEGFFGEFKSKIIGFL